MLKGIRIIELCTVIAAPTACAQLADLGADVIKVESPKAPDMSRAWGHNDDPKRTADPEMQRALKERRGGGGSSYIQINRGKRSVLVDFQKPEGVAIVKQLMETADVFVTNIRLQGLKKVGLDFETVHKEFPRLIYAHFTAFGRDGPKVNDPGYDYGAFWANTGIGDIVRTSDESSTVRVPAGFGDNASATQLAGWIGMALYHREVTGEGQLVDATLFRAGLNSMTQLIMQYLGGNPFGNSKGARHVRSTSRFGERVTMVTNATFLCKDNVLVQFLGEDMRRHVKKTMKALGVSIKDLFGSDQPRYSSFTADQWREVTKKIDAVMASKTYEEWKPILKEHDVWHVVVQRFENMMQDEQVHATGMLVDVPGLKHKLFKAPIYMGADQAIPTRNAPHFGQHTQEILSEIGYNDEALERLRKAGVVR